MAGILKPNSDLLQGNEEGRYIIHGYNLYNPAENLFNGSMSARVTSGYIGTSTRKTEPWAYWYGASNYLDIEFLDDVHIWDTGHSNLSNAKEIDIYNGKYGIKGQKVGTLEAYTLTYNEATPNWQKVASLKKGRYLIGYTASLHRVCREWYLEKQQSHKFLLLQENGEVNSIDSIAKIINKLPTTSEQSFIAYGMETESPIQIDGTLSSKNYILTESDSKNTDGLWTTQINRKPLSIKFN